MYYFLLKGKNYSPEGFANVIECFQGLNKNDQEEFLKLDNRFMNPQTIKEYLKIKNIVEDIKDIMQDQSLDLDLMIEIICIHLTNTYGNEFGIKISRFNHRAQSFTFFVGRSLSRHKHNFFICLCLNGTFPWRNYSVKSFVHEPKWEE